jgi:hypothetical protein
MSAIRGVLALAALLALFLPCNAADKQVVGDYWLKGRSSWYGNQEGKFVAAFAPFRGGGKDAFGILEWGGCGLTNGDGTIPWDRAAVTSYADENPDFPGRSGTLGALENRIALRCVLPCWY